ncbi:MAG: hypothetical protein O3A00_28365, partial [Planctomycetota bacterium]|nr:hypothetical protein [Planctomycetota bacterium]
LSPVHTETGKSARHTETGKSARPHRDGQECPSYKLVMAACSCECQIKAQRSLFTGDGHVG